MRTSPGSAAFISASSQRPGSHSATPGPGAYEANRRAVEPNTSNPGHNLRSMSALNPGNNGSTPGPGAYMAAALSGHSFSRERDLGADGARSAVDEEGEQQWQPPGVQHAVGGYDWSAVADLDGEQYSTGEPEPRGGTERGEELAELAEGDDGKAKESGGFNPFGWLLSA